MTVSLWNNSDNESSKSATKRLYVIHDQNGTDFDAANESDANNGFETKNIKSNFYDYLDAFIIAKGNIKARGGDSNTDFPIKK